MKKLNRRTTLWTVAGVTVATLAVQALGLNSAAAASDNPSPGAVKREAPPPWTEPLRLDIASLRKKSLGGISLDLDLVIQHGLPTIEPRLTGEGGHHKLVLTFSKPVLDGLAGVDSGNARLAERPSFSGKTMTVLLENVKNGELIKVNLMNVVAEDGTHYSGDISFRTLAGDLNRDGVVDVKDVISVSKRLSNPALLKTAPLSLDIDMDGKISPVDLIAIEKIAGVAAPK
jgi:hypothetical protein